jgi:hypothetical protein
MLPVPVTPPVATRPPEAVPVPPVSPGVPPLAPMTPPVPLEVPPEPPVPLAPPLPPGAPAAPPAPPAPLAPPTPPVAAFGEPPSPGFPESLELHARARRSGKLAAIERRAADRERAPAKTAQCPPVRRPATPSTECVFPAATTVVDDSAPAPWSSKKVVVSAARWPQACGSKSEVAGGACSHFFRSRVAPGDRSLRIGESNHAPSH